MLVTLLSRRCRDRATHITEIGQLHDAQQKQVTQMTSISETAAKQQEMLGNMPEAVGEILSEYIEDIVRCNHDLQAKFDALSSEQTSIQNRQQPDVPYV